MPVEYVPNSPAWQDKPSVLTPMSAARMNHIELGLQDVAGDTQAAVDALTAALAAAQPIVRIKTTDKTVTSSTALSADAELVAPVLESKRYILELFLIYAGVTAADIKVGLTVPSGATWQLAPDALLAATAATSGDMERAISTSGSLVLGANGAGTKLLAKVSGTLITSTSAGEVAVTVAQQVSNATGSVLYAGSALRLSPST